MSYPFPVNTNPCRSYTLIVNNHITYTTVIKGGSEKGLDEYINIVLLLQFLDTTLLKIFVEVDITFNSIFDQ